MASLRFQSPSEISIYPPCGLSRSLEGVDKLKEKCWACPLYTPSPGPLFHKAPPAIGSPGPCVPQGKLASSPEPGAPALVLSPPSPQPIWATRSLVCWLASSQCGSGLLREKYKTVIVPRLVCVLCGKKQYTAFVFKRKITETKKKNLVHTLLNWEKK